MSRLTEALSIKRETKDQIKVGIWGFIGGAIVAMVIGFNWGGWSTSGTTQKLAEEAVLQNQATICVAQVMHGLKNKDKMAEFQKLDSYDRSTFIEKGGWDKMTGQKEASNGVSRACAEGLQPLLSMR